MKKLRVFLSSMGVFVVLAWLAGYNFDTREFWVAYYALTALIASYLLSIPFDD